MTRPTTLQVSAHLPLHEWASLRTELIWIYDREVRAQYRHWKSDGLPGNRAWLIRRGTVSIVTATKTFIAGPGTWIMPPKAFAETRFSPDAHIISVHFLCQWPSGENIVASRGAVSFPAERYPSLEREATKLERMLRRQFPNESRHDQVYTHQSSDYGSFLRLQSLFFNWLATWFHVQMELGTPLARLTSGDSRPFQAARCLNESPLNQPYPIGRLQQQGGLGLMRLNQLFYAEFGMTTRKYWDGRRLDWGKQCLETSRMPMKEIAFRLGFRSDSHFVIWFRRLTGSRPGDYRKNYLALL